ncbi:sugar ABC transporter permease [Clostridia bacterium]|nr:sugar ABC transporter permease [Clostridia bacterium]
MVIQRRSIGSRVFDLGNAALQCLIVFASIYPFLYVLFASVSNPARLVTYSGFLYAPLGFTMNAYRLIMRNGNIIMGYKNTFIYVTLGLCVNMVITILGAFVLSRKDLRLKRVLLWIAMFTMFFGGGLIPTFLVIKDLGMIDTVWSMVLPNALSTYNMLVLRTAFITLPPSLEESARLDGANDLTILLRILLPLIIPNLAVIALFYTVGHWNSWFNAMIYLRTRTKFPLQTILREILILSQEDFSVQVNRDEATNINELIKYATIIVATVPILCVYPFLQKYFIKGVMLGAVKE